MKPEVGIIGYGRFGRLAAHYLKRSCRVSVADLHPIRRLEPGVKKTSIAGVAKLHYLILAVPINRLPVTLRRIAPLIGSDTILFDVASVKEEPMKWMRALLPKTVSYVGTHPLFGPESAARSFSGKSIVLCPGRIAPIMYKTLRTSLRRAGLQVVELTPREHDRRMASTLFLSQFIGRAVAPFCLPNLPDVTESYSFLKLVSERASSDTSELFFDMYKYNRYATRVPSKVLRSVLALTSRLGSRTRSQQRRPGR